MRGTIIRANTMPSREKIQLLGAVDAHKTSREDIGDGETGDGGIAHRYAP